MAAWVTVAYHFVSSVVNCAVEHSAEIAKTAVDFGTCMASKFFIS